jgi:general secretion pathway protein L
MASVVDKSVRKFFAWWGGELRAMAPAVLRDLLFPMPTRLELFLDGDTLRLAMDRGGVIEPLGETSLKPESRDALVREARALAGRSGRAADEVVLRLPAYRVLEPAMEAPAVAAGHLREVLALEMDRNTPFKAEDVFFDFKVREAASTEDRLSIAVRVAKKKDVENAVAFAREIGLPPTRVDGPRRRDGWECNLLPGEGRRTSGSILPKLNVAAAILAICLGGAWIYLSAERDARALALVEAETARYRAAAAEVGAMRDEAAKLVAAAKSITERKAANPMVAVVIDEVARRASDDHWFIEISYREGEVLLSGYSSQPAALLRSLEDSPLLEGVAFAAPTVADPSVERERFRIRAIVRPGGEG